MTKRIIIFLKSHGLFLLLIVLSIGLAYKDFPQTFFQQDEWLGFGNNIYYQSRGLTGFIESFFPGDPIQHFNPLAIAYSWLTFFVFGINFTPYAWLSILLHIVNSLLLYYFVSSWFKNKKIAFIAALFFGVNSIPSQAVTWVANTNSYEIPTALTILSLIFFHKFLKEEKHQKVNIMISFLMILVSFLFHENTIFIFIFYPVILLLFTKSERKKLFPIFSYAIAIFILLFVLIRIPLFFFGFSNPVPPAVNIDRPPIVVYPYRIISLSMKAFAASLFPQKALIQISGEVVKLAYPQFIATDNAPNPYITQSIVFDLVSYLLTIIIVCIAVLFIKFVHDKNIRKAILCSLIFVPLSVIPYAFVLGKAGYASIFEPKFLYIPSIGVSLFLAVVVYELIVLSKTSKIKTTFLLLFLGLYMLFHTFQTRAKIDELQKMGSQIKTFISTIHSSYPHLPQNIVFFTRSDTTYYGMPDNEKLLPTEVGFGKILMIRYQDKEKFPSCFYENNYLLYLLAQGYKECDGRGFGYFRDYDKLVAAIKTNNISTLDVISYSWNGDTEEFTDITKQIRNKINAEMLSQYDTK